MLLQWEGLSDSEKLAIKVYSEASLIGFVRIFFQLIYGMKFKPSWHHYLICDVLENIYHGRVNREIVNCPPGASKTVLCSIMWPAWCILMNMRESEKRPTRWLPCSYSSSLVDESGSLLRDILLSDEFNHHWPLEPDKTKNAKSDWRFTDAHRNEHRLFGSSVQGQLTGRRAGYMIDGFSGALIIDDPVPPKDESSALKMGTLNKSLNRIIRSRLAQDDIPILMIQQRIANGDSTEFLMSDKSPDVYGLTLIPAIPDADYIRKNRLQGNQKAEESYWVAKEPTSALRAIKKADPFLFFSQYQQQPDDALLEGVIFRKELDAALADGRVLAMPVEKALPTYTCWDLGINDDMSCWIIQVFGRQVRLVGCKSGNNLGIEPFINWLHDFRDLHDVRYVEHFAPHDIAVRDIFTGRSRQDTAETMGIDFTKVERCKLKRDAINALRLLFPQIVIDPGRCKVGYEAIKKYRREYDDENEVFLDKPVHDKHSNPMDALMQFAQSWTPAPITEVRTVKRVRKRNWRAM